MGLRIAHWMLSLRTKLMLALLLCAVIEPTGLSSQEDLLQLINQVRPSVVTVIGFNGDGKPISQGTGFFVASNGTLITNYHVLVDAQMASIKTKDGMVYEIVETVAEDIDGDLIAVRANIGALVVLPLRIPKAPVLPGQRVIVIGSPLGLDQTVSEGIVSAVRQSDDFGRIIQITAPLSPGSSGSPVIRTTGEVVGVAALYLRNGQNLNFAIRSDRITRLLSRSNKTARGGTRGSRVRKVKADNAKRKEKMADRLFAEMFEEERRSIPMLADRIRKNPGDIEAYERLGRAYSNNQDPKKAIEVYLKALLVASYKLSIRVSLCDAYSDVEQYDQALIHCDKALRLSPSDTNALRGKGRAFIGLGKNIEAIEVLKEAIRENPEETYTHESLGFAYMNVGQYVNAVKAFEFMASIASRYAPSFANLAWAYESLGRNDEAEVSYKKAIQIDSKFDDAYIRLGRLYEREKRTVDAISIYRRAIKANPKNGDAYLNLGLLYLSTGDRRSTLDIYESLKKIDPAKARQLSGAIYH